ncbi:hypothetical protein F4808DRAFT_392555 [Astrocystis sublimbata]|nr:hypothetical protein F4808DRAFT_392555 [Astrocystis sublimbata]
MLSSIAAQNSAAQKHRACDECRTRKLACTKEPEGCSRCRRENIACHYSAQKQMGRPRKRARDLSDDDLIAATPQTKLMTELPPDTEDPGMEFINMLLLGNDIDFDFDPFPPQQPTATTTTATATAVPPISTTTEIPTSTREVSWGYHDLGNVNFDSQPAEQSQSYPPSSIDPALVDIPTGLDPPSADQVPGLSPPNSNTTNSPQSSETSSNAAASFECECTANLCSALTSMQMIPSEVEAAIRQARLAAKVAYQVVNCTKCSLDPPVQPVVGSPTMMRGFQNLMLLAALIPSIVSAYYRMLAIVDEETNRATAECRRVIFKLNGLGGIWGALGGEGGKACSVTTSFGHKEMEPVMWRLTVRALLRIDVYGVSGCFDSMDRELADPFHLGLKDIVLLMENKAKARHQFMDAMVDAGVWKSPDCNFMNTSPPGELPQCQRIIAIARASVEKLTIA